MLHCFQCGKDLPDNLAFCLFCGAQLNDDAATVVRPVVETQPVASGGGAGKFILGSLIGAVSVIALVAIAAFVIMSMRGEDKPQNVIAVPAATPTPTPTKATATPTPVRQTPTPSREVFVKPEPVERVCSVVNPEEALSTFASAVTSGIAQWTPRRSTPRSRRAKR